MAQQALIGSNDEKLEEASSGYPFALPRVICLVMAGLLTIVSFACYYQSTTIKELWPWQDQAMTYRFAAAYLFAFAGSLLWIAISGEMSGLSGVALTVIVNSAGMTTFLALYSFRHDTSDLVSNIIGMVIVLAGGFYAFRRGHRLPAIHTNRTPTTLRIAMIVFPIILFIASTRLILQQTNVFPWDPQPQFSTVIGLCLMGSVFYFVFGAFKGIWAHAGGQFAGFLAYDLVLLPPYLRMLNADDSGATGSASGFTTYASTVNSVPLYIFLTAIILSLILSVWYLFFDRRTRMFGR